MQDFVALNTDNQLSATFIWMITHVRLIVSTTFYKVNSTTENLVYCGVKNVCSVPVNVLLADKSSITKRKFFFLVYEINR